MSSAHINAGSVAFVTQLKGSSLASLCADPCMCAASACPQTPLLRAPCGLSMEVSMEVPGILSPSFCFHYNLMKHFLLKYRCSVCLLGWRIGKGEGYADLEYAMMVSMGAVSQGTPVVTIVHDCQVLPVDRRSRATAIPPRERAGREGDRHTGIDWCLPSFHICWERWYWQRWRCLAVKPYPMRLLSPVLLPCGAVSTGATFPVSSLTHFCLTRSSTYLKRCSRTTT